MVNREFYRNHQDTGEGKTSKEKQMESRLHTNDSKYFQLAPANSHCTRTGCQFCCETLMIDLSSTHLSMLKFEQSGLNDGLNPKALPEEIQVFWRCTKENHLIYESVAHLKRQGWQCSSCLKQRVAYLCNLPDLAAQLISIEGSIKNPAHIRCASQAKATWRCSKGTDHIWSTPVYARACKKNGCPFCANRRVSMTNSLCNFPEVAAELHPIRNQPFTAETIIASSTKMMLWWQCSRCRHQWKDTPSNRTRRGYHCPQCENDREREAATILKRTGDGKSDLTGPTSVTVGLIERKVRGKVRIQICSVRDGETGDASMGASPVVPDLICHYNTQRNARGVNDGLRKQ